MPFYSFACNDCDHVTTVFGKMACPPIHSNCDKCDSHYTYRIFGNRVNTFTPYTEQNLPGGPVEFTTAEHRDRVLDQHNLTYDSAHWVRRKSFRSAVEDVKLKDVAEDIQNGKTGKFAEEDANLPPLPDSTVIDS